MDQAAVRGLARQIFVGLAPEEADEFDSKADAWFADPRRASAVRPERRDPLGFGPAEVSTIVVPIVLYIGQHILSATTEVTAEEGVKRLARRFGRPKRDKPGEEQPGDEAEALAREIPRITAAYGGDPDAVRRAVRAAGKEYGADAELVEKIAEQVLEVLEL
jgi:hypothetical protein